MTNDKSSFPVMTAKWDSYLRLMADTDRASRGSALNDALILLALIHIGHRDQLPMIAKHSDKSYRSIREFAELIENRNHIGGRLLSETLVSGFANIRDDVLLRWIDIATKDLNFGGFEDWFTGKLDDLTLAYLHDTPSSLAQLVASLLAKPSAQKILDPACGTGGLLAAIARAAKSADLFGQEMSVEACAWAQLRFLVLGLNVKLATGNALSNPAFMDAGSQNEFDFVLTNPPFGMHIDAAVMMHHLSVHRSLLTQPSGRLSSVAAYVQEAISRLSISGAAAVIVPKGFLYRSGSDQRLREALIREDYVQAVIGLPERLFAPATTIETAILLLNRKKAARERKHIMFLTARQLGKREGVKVVLDGPSTDRIKTTLTSWHDEVSFARVVALSELDHSGCSLLPSRYITLADDKPARIDPAERRERILEMEARYAELSSEYEMLRSRLTYDA